VLSDFPVILKGFLNTVMQPRFTRT